MATYTDNDNTDDSDRLLDRPHQHQRNSTDIDQFDIDDSQVNQQIIKQSIKIPKVEKKYLPTGIEKFILEKIMRRNNILTGKPLLYFTTAFVSTGVFLFGYDQGVMSSLLIQDNFKDYFDDPNANEIGAMVAILEVGALLSSLIVGTIGDLIGRRLTIMYGAAVFVIGGTFQTFALSLGMMIIGRFIAGLGIGMLSTIVPVYQSEISPPTHRGKLACLEFAGNISGFASSIFIGYGSSFIKNNWSWRLPLAMQLLMGGILVIGCFLIAETPRWLLDNDYDEQGLRAIANLFGNGDVNNPKAQQEFREIKEAVLIHRMEGKRTYKEMWRKYKRRVLIAMSSLALAQLEGINVVSYYLPPLLQSAGWKGRSATLMAGVNALFYLSSTFLAWYAVDKWGRRFILLSGSTIMAIALCLVSYFEYLEIPQSPKLVILFVIIYNFAFGASWGPIPWLYPSEILPLSVRAKGASLATCTNWVFNAIVGNFVPILHETIHWRLYLIPAFFCVIAFITVYFTYPETMGVTLEEMGSLFDDKSTVRGRGSSASRSRGRDITRALLHNNDDDDDNVDEESQIYNYNTKPSPAAMDRARNVSPGFMVSAASPSTSSIKAATPDFADKAEYEHRENAE